MGEEEGQRTERREKITEGNETGTGRLRKKKRKINQREKRGKIS